MSARTPDIGTQVLNRRFARPEADAALVESAITPPLATKLAPSGSAKTDVSRPFKFRGLNTVANQPQVSSQDCGTNQATREPEP